MNFMNAEARKAAGHSQWLRATRLVYWGDLAAHASWSWEMLGAWSLKTMIGFNMFQPIHGPFFL